MISIAMTTYNGEKYIKQQLDSILNQTYTDIELIICDDCSVDGTYGILLEYKNQYPDKFVILRNKVNSKLAIPLLISLIDRVIFFDGIFVMF